MRTRYIALVIAALLLLTGCGGAQQKAQQPAAGGGQPQQNQQPDTGAKAKRWEAPPSMQIDTTKSYVATIKTDQGDMKVELFTKDAPKTVNNFVFLARQGYYDGLTFHRVIKGFMIQGGDPNGDGTGGPGYTIPDELPVKRKYGLGMVAMARTSAPNSAGSQFFICNDPACGGLDRQPNYVQFGQVVDGLDVLQKLSSVEVVSGGEPVPSKPKTPPVIKTITISEQ